MLYDITNKTKSFFKNKEGHRFHLVDNSQLPLTVSTAVILLVMSFVFYFHSTDSIYVHFFDNLSFQGAWLFFSIVLFSWFIRVLKESAQGYHTWAVRNGLRFGMVLFIVSEIMFFFAFFWAFFHVSLSPSISVGSIWPPKSMQALDVWGLPLINTILLLTSGVAITFAHHAMLKYTNAKESALFIKHLSATVLLGTIFLFCQWIEYKYGIIFRWKENVYGTTFFVTTGFHGFHVTIGNIFLLFCLIRAVITAIGELDFTKNPRYIAIANSTFLIGILDRIGFKNEENKEISLKEPNSVQNSFQKFWGKFSFRKNQHVGFETSAWYWHFVDVVWIFLFITVYWWGA